MSGHEDRVALTRRTYDAFNRRDTDAVLADLDPAVDWPNVLDGIRLHGHGEVRDYWERQFREINPQVEPTEFIPDGNGLIVEVHQLVCDLQGNLLSDSAVAHSYSFRGDLVLRMDVHPTIDDPRL